MTIESTSTLSLHVREHYERTFLENLKKNFQFADFTKKFTVPKGFGPTAVFSRFQRMSGDTSTLTEGTVPSEVQLTDERVSATVAQYGNFLLLSDLILSTHLSGFNPFVEQALVELTYKAKASVDLLVRNAFSDGTVFEIVGNTGGKVYADIVGSADGARANDVRKIVKTLRKADVPYYDGGNYIGIIGPGQTFDFMSEVAIGAWLDAHKYTDSERLQKGEVGKLYSTRFVEQNQLSTDSQSGTISECYFFGKDAVAMIDLTDVASKAQRTEMKHINIYIQDAGSAGSADPLHQRATVGYKFNLAVKLLEDSRVVTYQVGETT